MSYVVFYHVAKIELKTSLVHKKDITSVVGSCTVRGLREVISWKSFPHIMQCVEVTARTCDLSVHMRQSLPLALGRPSKNFTCT
jgi:hypothetical protein